MSADLDRAAVEVMAKGILDAWRKEDPNLQVLGPPGPVWVDAGPESAVDLDVFATAALRALREAGFWIARWEPIETAPTDGTRVVAVEGITVEAMWWANDVWATGWVNEINRSDTYIYNPTHWTPLPPPPQEPTDGK